MAFDTYIKIDTVKGESTAEGMTDFMEIMSFSFGASNPSSVGPGGGGSGGGRVSVSSFNVMKKSEAASATLFMACAQGDHFKTAEVVLRKAGGKDNKQSTFLTYKFEEVYVDSIQWSGSGGGDDSPTESVSFSFGKVEIEYSKQDATGKMAKAGQAIWDLRAVAAK